MCGIAGIISLDDRFSVDPQMVERMTQRLTHRGPDEGGLYADPTGRAVLGFRRLSIIDLATGRQPLANEDESIHLICNGEIYNFQSLRASLEREGHQFRTAGDIEPIVHLYEEHGSRFLDYLDGFFALAMFDARRRKLILAIDRVGKKPLYYAFQKGLLYFASELKAVTAIIPETSIDNTSLVDYLRLGYIPAPNTIYTGIQKLPPGHKLEIDLNYHSQLLNRDVPPPIRYYTPSPTAYEGTFDEAKSQLSDLLTRAVEKRLIADVPVGVLLSGGLDSAIVTALASKSASSPIKTFSVGFKNELYNELPLAKLVAERYKTDHTELMVEPDAEAALDLVANVYDEPFADSSAIPTYLVCQKARELVTVVLTGDGGDEAFAGYDRYRGFAITSFLSKLKMNPIGEFLSRFLTCPGPEQRSRRARAWRMIQALRVSPGMQYSLLMRLFYEDQLRRFVGPALREEFTRRPDLIAQCIDGSMAVKSPIEKANLCDVKTYLPGDLLVKMDRASMANSLEARSPMLDVAVLEFAHSLPIRFRCDRHQGKKILRSAFAPLLPPELLTAPKRGFGVPLADWLRGPLKSQMESILNPHSRLIQQGLFTPAALTRLQTEHHAGQFDHSARLWSLMVLEKFLDQH
jgi:asparagine synthase (glutamine-hydrolysing)